MIKTVLFDLDGTLLAMDQDSFIQAYFQALTLKMSQCGYDAKKVIHGLAKGSMAMVLNDGSMSNEEKFWEVFQETTQLSREVIEKDFYDFYLNEFNEAGKQIPKNEAMIKAVQWLKAKGYQLILATNPLFPAIATQNRIRWAGLEVEDFDYITTYENSSYCKPNPAYFNEILERLHLNVNECIMVGNDIEEDGAASQVKLPLYFIQDCLINKRNLEISGWLGNSEQFLALVQSWE